MSFTQRYLSAQFTLGTGQFGGNAGNVLTVGVKDASAPILPTIGAPADALRMAARIDRAGGAAVAQLSMDIYGMKLSDMNTLSTLGYVATTYKKNSILVKAGDAETGQMSTVFQGVIYDAYVDITEQPDVRFHVNAQTAMTDALDWSQPSSWNGSVDVSTVLEDIANQLGWPFESNGVSVMLNNPYFSGSLLDQAQQAVEDAGLDWNKGEDGKLAWWIPGKFRQGTIPLISKLTGLVSYVAYNSLGIQFTTIFNPGISFGGKVNVQSSQLLQKQQTLDNQGNVSSSTISANGIWGVTQLNHRLECLTPNGDWFSDVRCSPVGYVVAPGGG